jgi:hypothetical protein
LARRNGSIAIENAIIEKSGTMKKTMERLCLVCEGMPEPVLRAPKGPCRDQAINFALCHGHGSEKF